MKPQQFFPKNKEHFKKLIPFAQKIIKVCRENKIDPIIYGSFSHFVHTGDKNLNVNDIDLIIPKKDLPKIAKVLLRKKIKSKDYPEYNTIIIEKGKLKIEIEIDEIGAGRKTISDDKLSKNIFDRVDFYGTPIRIIRLNQLEEIYSYAYNNSREDKTKILEKIKRLEKSLGRKLKQDIFVEIVKNKNLTKNQKDNINKARKKEFGKNEAKDFSKDYEPETLWFFVKKKNRIVSLGGIRPIKMKFLGKQYKIGGICSTISLEKKKGYGKIMVAFMIDYSRKTGKTILGFTGKTEFFEKADMGTKKYFIKRFVWIKKNGEKVYDDDGDGIYDDDGDGIYYDGRDKLISKILKTKSPAYIFVEHW